MILPPGAVLGKAAKEARQPSQTFQLDLKSGRIAGKADGLDAVKQAVLLILSTERFAHFIYSSNYGLDRRRAGSSGSDLERLVKEALLQDDRITAIEKFESTVTGDEVSVRFTVVSIFGSTTVEGRL